MLLSGFDPMPDEARTLLEQRQGLLGMATAYAIRALTADHPELVTEALRLVADQKLKQTAIPAWVDARMRAPTIRQSKDKFVITRAGYPDVQVVVAEGQAVIKAPGIDAAALNKLIQDNLSKLLHS